MLGLLLSQGLVSVGLIVLVYGIFHVFRPDSYTEVAVVFYAWRWSAGFTTCCGLPGSGPKFGPDLA